MAMSIKDLAAKGCPCGCGATLANGGLWLNVTAVLSHQTTFHCRSGFSGYWSTEQDRPGADLRERLLARIDALPAECRDGNLDPGAVRKIVLEEMAKC